ncbi:hypothetical protein CKM354_000778100 [Cercospora kikuchii]|uniref:Zn(2)-C6 fungal-type domain-containing protein n=1 Tax=Cercospora kikuchii TaxID=84275 RepID=A0A9P3CNE2_9PEZI|nr:uncharacterized protein CKM354_000778100 [Cercospora kikuchii]GIZ44587.1 hypothetical protein CKM354_000778100 [Cercospora kikuchii]
MSQIAVQGKRRPHRKSRNGCKECRRRRIKCDETRPRCLACERYDHECVYKEQVEVVSATASPSTPAESPAGTLDNDSITLSANDLYLLHHWTRVGSRSIDASPKLHDLWQDLFPRIGFKHHFVLHAILALSALHLADQEPAARSSRYWHDAVYHHVEALGDFHKTIHRIPELSVEVCEALFACATINVVIVLCLNFRFGKESDDDAEQRVLGATWIPMVRGVQVLLAPTYDRVRLGHLAPLLHNANWDDLDPQRDPCPEDEHLRRLGSVWADDDDRELYDQTLYNLRKSYAHTMRRGSTHEGIADWSEHKSSAGPLLWVYATSETFFSRLNERKDAALLLFAHFGVLLYQLDIQGHWWVRGGGQEIVAVVDNLLSKSPCAAWMEWPKNAVSHGQYAGISSVPGQLLTTTGKSEAQINSSSSTAEDLTRKP